MIRPPWGIRNSMQLPIDRRLIIYYIKGVTENRASGSPRAGTLTKRGLQVPEDLLKQEIRTMKKNALQALAVFAFLAIAVGGDIATSLL